MKEYKPKWEKKGEFVGEVIGNIIALFIVNMAPTWFPGFFTEGYTALLWVFNVSIVIQILGNIALITFSPKYFYHLIRTLLNGVSVASMIVMVMLFPFNIPYGLSTLLRLILVIAIVATSIATIVEFIKIFFPEVRLDGRATKRL